MRTTTTSRRTEAQVQSNETVVEDDEVEAHGGTVQSNETVVEDDAEVEAHGGGIQSNETVVEDE